MWKQVFKLLCVLTAANNIQAYINNDDYSHRNQKNSYLDYQIQQFNARISTTARPRAHLAKTYTSSTNHRRYAAKNLPVTETPIRHYESQHKFRHTRFQKMDGLLSKISRFESDNKDVNKRYGHHRWTTERSYLRRPTTTPTTTTTEATDDFEDDYDDSDEDEDVRKSDDSSFDWDDDDDEDLDDEFTDENDENNNDNEKSEDNQWQAEEATKAPETFTEFKWRHYGTRSRVEESRRNHKAVASESSKITQAADHALRMNSQAACRIPRPRVVSVQSVYPDPSKTYTPHCTVLHQCGEDAGCCRAESLTCASKNTVKVELYFYSKSVGRQDYVVEKLPFYNHTECECVERSSIMSGDRPQTTHLRSGINFRPTVQEPQVAPAAIRRCRCPELYTALPSNDNHCRCDCSEGNRDCLRIKRGKEYFSLKDRLCIQNGQCGYPNCDFGAYIRHSGRCPRKQEKFEAFARMAPK